MCNFPDARKPADVCGELHDLLDDPDLAFQNSLLPNDGVDLARMEFITSEAIKVHPMALLKPEWGEDENLCTEIERLVARHETPGDVLNDHARDAAFAFGSDAEMVSHLKRDDIRNMLVLGDRGDFILDQALSPFALGAEHSFKRLKTFAPTIPGSV